MKRYQTLFTSPIGNLRVVVDADRRLLAIDFHGEAAPERDAERSPSRCAHVTGQLAEYFAGRRHDFDLELALQGTEFLVAVWRELQRVPFGATISYAELAKRIGRPRAVRAVGQANGANKVPIVVPCHRVIGASGTLTGFGGGLEIKRALLELEGATAHR